MIKRILFIFLLLISQYVLFAQDNMATEMRSNGKIYVVVAVLTAIFIGIILYLIRLDRKISKLEKETRINH